MIYLVLSFTFLCLVRGKSLRFSTSNQLLATFNACQFCIIASTRHLMCATSFENQIRDFCDILCARKFMFLRYCRLTEQPEAVDNANVKDV